MQNGDKPDASDLGTLKFGRLSNERYDKRINEIFLNQRKALEPDNPAITESESEADETVTSTGQGDCQMKVLIIYCLVAQ